MSSLRDKLLAKTERRIKAFELDGDQYHARSLTAAEFARVQGCIFAAQSSAIDKGELFTRANAMAVRMSLCDESGEAILCDADVDRLLEIDHAELTRLADACNEVINTITVEASAKN
jgi:hypothetical protein